MNEGFWIVVLRDTDGEHELCWNRMGECEDLDSQVFLSESEAIRVRDRMQKIFTDYNYWVKYVAWGEFA